jgi:hypothetical protein
MCTHGKTLTLVNNMQQEKFKQAAWTEIYFLKRPSTNRQKLNISAKLKLLFWQEKLEFKRKMFEFLDGAKIYDLVLKARLIFRVNWNGELTISPALAGQ